MGCPWVMLRPEDSSEDDIVHLSVVAKCMTNIDTKVVTSASQPFNESPSTDPGPGICNRAWAPLQKKNIYGSPELRDVHALVCQDQATIC